MAHPYASLGPAAGSGKMEMGTSVVECLGAVEQISPLFASSPPVDSQNFALNQASSTPRSACSQAADSRSALTPLVHPTARRHVAASPSNRCQITGWE